MLPFLTGSESHYGLFNHDETPKSAARALHFLSGLLNDSVTTPNPGLYSFTLSGLPIGAQYVLFQNSNGTLFLVLWNNAPVYDPLTQTDLTATPVQVFPPHLSLLEFLSHSNPYFIFVLTVPGHSVILPITYSEPL
jgi:hypothetical protein